MCRFWLPSPAVCDGGCTRTRNGLSLRGRPPRGLGGLLRGCGDRLLRCGPGQGSTTELAESHPGWIQSMAASAHRLSPCLWHDSSCGTWPGLSHRSGLGWGRVSSHGSCCRLPRHWDPSWLLRSRSWQWLLRCQRRAAAHTKSVRRWVGGAATRARRRDCLRRRVPGAELEARCSWTHADPGTPVC